MEGQRILVLGATGLIGFPLATELARNNEVIGVNRFRKRSAEELAERNVVPLRMDITTDPFIALPDGIDYVFNEVMLYDPTSYDESMEVNAYPVAKLMQRYEGCRGIVLGSTGSVYASTGDPMKEGAPLAGNDAYSLSKICAEKFAVHFSRELDIPTSILRYYHPYSVAGGVIPSLRRAVEAGSSITLADILYSPLFISDVVRYTIEAASRCASPPWVVNICGKEIASRREIVNMLCESLGRDPASLSFADGAQSPSEIGDCSEQVRLLGPQQVSLAEGVRRVAEASSAAEGT